MITAGRLSTLAGRDRYGAYKKVGFGYDFPGHGWTKDVKEGTLYTVYGIEQGGPQLGPTDCGGKASKTVTVSGGVGKTIAALGFTFSVNVSASLSVSKEIGGEPHRRFKAIPIWPKVDIFDNRAWYRTHELVIFGQVRTTTSPWDNTQNVPSGKNYLDGVDFKLWGACCK